MIAAIYLESLSMVMPVNPVSRVERITPQGRGQGRSGSQKKTAFALLLASMTQAGDSENEEAFDALA